MNNVHRFPAPVSVTRLCDEADARERAARMAYDEFVRVVNDRDQKRRDMQRITNRDVWAKVKDGTFAVYAAAAFVIGVVIGVLQNAGVL